MEYQTKTAIIIATGSVALIFFVMLLVLITSNSKRKVLKNENALRELERKKQIELFREIAKAEESQKQKIAANFHDHIIPVLLLKIRNMENLVLDIEKNGIGVEDLKRELESLSGLSDDIRDIAHDLIPRLFTSFGFLKSLEVFIKQMNGAGKSAAEFHNNTFFSGELPFTKEDQLIVYRICLEILNNLFKHAKYEYLNVTLEDMKENLVLQFAHDGMGITNEEIAELSLSSKGIGLKSLESRALFLNAKIDYSKDIGVSYVKLIIPLKK